MMRQVMGEGIVAGRYRLLRQIGRGGMGRVYAAHDSVMQREVAVKILREEASYDPDARARFEREARAPQRIRHPGLTEIYDAFTDVDGRMVLVMELLEGQSFQELMDHDMPLEGMLALLRAALDPLAAAHAAGYVHRDMKPANLFLADGAKGLRVKLLDFGVARELGDGAMTATGVIVGSTNYIAPEQVHSARNAPAAADVFSVGAMIYEAVSGTLPFADDSPLKTLSNLAAGEYTPLDERVPNANPALVALVHRCLSLEPEDRPKDAAALIPLLDPFAPSTLPSLPPAHKGPKELPRTQSSVPVPGATPQAADGPRARGVMMIGMAQLLKQALQQGRKLPLDATDREWLAKRLILSGWYPFERFEWLATMVHRQLRDGSDEAAIGMGREAARLNVGSGVHHSFVYEGSVRRTLRAVRNMWGRYVDFGKAEVVFVDPTHAKIEITGYEFAPRIHELMLIGWCEVLVELAGGEVRESELTRAPSKGDPVWELHLRYEPAPGEVTLS